MAEYGVNQPLLPQLPPTVEEIKERIAAVRRANEARQTQIDQTFIDVVQSLTNIDLTQAVESGRRTESLGGGSIGPESLLIDQLITAPTASSADLPPGVDERGRPRSINQNQQTTFVIDSDGQLVEVQMLPVWTRDP